MADRFDTWNEIKKDIDSKDKRVHFRQGEVWFASLGQNVGHEAYGKGEKFLRPVVIYRKFSKKFFLAIPLTSKTKSDRFHVEIEIKNKKNSAMLSQIRTIDAKRLKYKADTLNRGSFDKLENAVGEFYKITPQKRGGYTHKSEQRNVKKSISNYPPNVNCKHILLTGTAGFIGSNFASYFLDRYPEYHLLSLDALTYAGNLDNLKDINNHPRHTFIHGDICDRVLVQSIFTEYDIQGVIHFAAESHVDNSIKDPETFIKTNVIGTYTLIDVAKSHWMEKPFVYKKKYQGCRFHHISTDEVYGTLGDNPDELFKETTPYAPNSPYSASKASSDMIVRSYYHTYGLNTIITNCSNNYGPKQHDEKLIPTIIRNALQGNPIPIYGDGKNIRDWLYVMDHCKGIDLAYHKGKAGEIYNIGGKNERTNLQIANAICDILDKKIPKDKPHKDLITFVEDRAGHDRRYAIDASKIENELGWKADEDFESGIVKAIEWYLDKYGR